MIKGNGIVYNSKHNSNLGKTIGMRFNTTSKFVTPGPGAYGCIWQCPQPEHTEHTKVVSFSDMTEAT